MPPGSFIPTFTKDGNDVLLDMYMTEVVCRTIRDWLSDGYDVKPISVNVSRNTASNENDYLGCVRNMMGLHEIPKDLLEFEILETSSEQGEDQVVMFINKFHQHGYKIAMDDFGTLLAVGVTSMFMFHILVNIGMTAGIMPVTGVPLPFLSYGVSSLTTNLLLIGILLNVSTRQQGLQFD